MKYFEPDIDDKERIIDGYRVEKYDDEIITVSSTNLSKRDIIMDLTLIKF